MTDCATPNLDEIASLVGQVCLKWADLETEVKYFAIAVARLRSDQPMPDVTADTLDIAISNMHMPQKVATARALSHLGDGVFPTYDLAEPIFNSIDNELRIERNRYVHDEWLIFPDNQIMRINSGSKIKKPQSRERELHYRSAKPFQDTKEVAELLNDIREADGALFNLRGAVEEFLKEKGLLEES